MDSFSLNKTGKIEFFGMTTATPDFLLKHRISFAHKGNPVDVMVETGPDGKPVMYLLDGLNRQLRVVTLAALKKRYAQVDGKADSITKQAFAIVARQDPPDELGKLLYLAHYEDIKSRAALISAAYDAAKGSGVTHATARWFSQDFVQDAFFGYGMDQEFTNQGIFRGPAAFSLSHKTIKRQLQQLQLAGVMAYEALPKEAGFYLQFNRQYLPGIKQERLPQFFGTFIF